MSHGDRIIDRDIQTYQAVVESEQARLRRCLPSLERYYRSRMNTAQAVLDALKAHRAAIDQVPTLASEHA